MKATIDFKAKRAHVTVGSVLEAGWLSFNFAYDHTDLIQDGWRLYYYEANDPGAHSRADSPVIAIDESGSELARAIKAGPPKSCCHDCCCRKGD
ncbi:hypothetical protein LCGC14_1125750 [marine sediment metagenome]|uniref:Uncharacterized protein n=1 Tax=marine sediment metagenome TaxID=412755 RepID=A0A0F9MQK5_9ZZZZ